MTEFWRWSLWRFQQHRRASWSAQERLLHGFALALSAGLLSHLNLLYAGCDSWGRWRSESGPTGGISSTSEHHGAAQQCLLCSCALELSSGLCNGRHHRYGIMVALSCGLSGREQQCTSPIVTFQRFPDYAFKRIPVLLRHAALHDMASEHGVM